MLRQFTICVVCICINAAAAQSLESRVLKEYEKRFFKAVEVKEITSRLYRRNVISQSVWSRIRRSDNDKEKQELLYDHLEKHGNVDSLKSFCEEAISADGYPNMQSLGQEMKDMLEQEGALDRFMFTSFSCCSICAYMLC